MDDQRPDIESRIDDLERRLRLIERRLPEIEHGRAHADASSEAEVDVGSDIPGASSSSNRNLVAVLTLAGRTFVVLGGAYLLRALTESAALAPRMGISLGFLYALCWLAAADRAASAIRTSSALFHGFTAVMIALPLLWEAVTRFQILGGATASLVLTAFASMVLAVSIRRRLQPLAWMVVGGGVTAATALIAATGALLPFALAEIVLGVITLWIGYTVDWVWLRWPVAFAADLAVLALAAGVSTGNLSAAPRLIVVDQLALLIAYLGSIVIRTLVRGREVNVFEIVQGSAALAIGFGGAVYVSRTTGLGAAALVTIGLACGIGCYGVAFAFIANRQGLRRNFYFYTSLALALVIAGTRLLTNEAALLWAALAVVAAWVTHGDRLTATSVPPGDLRPRRSAFQLVLTAHAAVYIVTAAAASGLLASATTALVGTTGRFESPISPSLLIVFVATAATWTMAPTVAAESWARASRLLRLMMAIVLTWTAAAWLVAMAASLAATTFIAHPGLVATVRTAALAFAALVLAWLGRSRRFREAGWLVYPVLATGALKLLVEDFQRSTPATLFLALAVYGGALIAAPRINQQCDTATPRGERLEPR